MWPVACLASTTQVADLMSTSTYKQSQPPASGMIPRLSVPHNYKGGIHNENIQGYWANSCYVNRRVCNRRRGSHLLSHESRSEEHTSELQSRGHLVCRLLLDKTQKNKQTNHNQHQPK